MSRGHRKQLVEGELAETRALEAARVCYNKPPWLLTIERASSIMDVQGVDLVARVEYPNQHTGLMPLQVKISFEGRDLYYTTHPDAYQADVPVVVIFRRDSPMIIFERTLRELQTRRLKNRRYDDYFASLAVHLCPRGQRIARKIEERTRLVAAE